MIQSVVEIQTDAQTAHEGAYLQYVDKRATAVKLAREKYPEEYAEYKKRELERAKRILDADTAAA